MQKKAATKRISYFSKVKGKPNASKKLIGKAKARVKVKQAMGTHDFELEVAALVNQERTSRGIPALAFNPTLFQAAWTKSRDMRDNNNFSHISPILGGPGQLLDRFGVLWRSYGENIAVGQATPAEVMRTWMNSPGHRANILNPLFTDIGVGYVPGTSTSQYSHYWTQLFIQKP